MNTRHLLRLALPATLLMPTMALAHPGHDTASAGLMAGLLHPLTGLDHMLMIVAVGAWAALLGPAGRWLVVASVGLFVAIGALLPVAAGGGLEVALALTVAAACLLLASGRRWPAWSAASLAGLFALVHGFAHGAEGPSQQLLYVPGLVVATSGLALATSTLVARWQAGRRLHAFRR